MNAEPSRSACIPLPDDRAEVLYMTLQPLVQRLLQHYGPFVKPPAELEPAIYRYFQELLTAYQPAAELPVTAYLIRELPDAVDTWVRGDGRAVQADGDGDLPTAEAQVQWVLGQLPAAIARLPLPLRPVVVWRYYEGRTFEEIARLLNVQVAAARLLLLQGLSGLRRQMDAAGDRRGATATVEQARGTDSIEAEELQGL